MENQNAIVVLCHGLKNESPPDPQSPDPPRRYIHRWTPAGRCHTMSREIFDFTHFFSKKNMGTKQSIDSWDPRFAEKWDFIIDFMV